MIHEVDTLRYGCGEIGLVQAHLSLASIENHHPVMEPAQAEC